VVLITRETDYALRILQNLLTGEKKPVGDICKEELIPQQFAYKIIKKLSHAGLVEITRGVDGGCRLSSDLEKTSLYDLMVIMDGGYEINACMHSDYACPRREKNGSCLLHMQLAAIQTRLNDELRSNSLMTLLTGQ